MAAPVKSLPKDAQVMSAILKDMGVLDFEPRLINQMLEFSYRYVTDVLDDAKVYSTHASKKTIDTDDVRLAVQCKMDHSFTSPPPRDLLIEVARHKNSQSMPLIKPYTGPRLPPDRYCLSAPNFKLAHKKKPPRIQFGLPMNQFSGGSRISLTQIPKPQVRMPLGGAPQPQKGLPVGNVTVINRPAQPRPLVRVQQGQPKPQNMPDVLGPGPGTSLLSMPNNAQHLQNLPPPNIAGQFQSAAYIPNIANPLKRKHEDDDYDHS